MKGAKITIFDTTLRDGEQAPGATMTPAEKVHFARQLERLGVDVIEAGFPAASKGDFAAVQRIAAEIAETRIAALARARIDDIDRAWRAVEGAASPRIHIIAPSSDILLKHQVRKAREQVLEEAAAAVDHASRYTGDIEFSAVDATRADRAFLVRLFDAAIASGARTVNVADTVGYAVPEQFGRLITYLLHHLKNMDKALLSVHCHDDLGLAVANSLAAVKAGAGQVKCTVNGIGERAGNAALEEVVMALETRRDYFGLRTGIRTEYIYETSRLLTSITGIAVQANKAIVGTNAFAHEAGIHQDGLIKERRTYEIMRPQSVGVSASRLVLGRHSGRHALKAHLEERGYRLTPEQLDLVFVRFKERADSVKHVSEDDLVALLPGEIVRNNASDKRVREVGR
ncbi:MAG: 2-isopropylmalate synthase [Syntrophorhabdales bacterium]|jgi:2-isopropylmalate synthase